MLGFQCSFIGLTYVLTHFDQLGAAACLIDKSGNNSSGKVTSSLNWKEEQSRKNFSRVCNFKLIKETCLRAGCAI